VPLLPVTVEDAVRARASPRNKCCGLPGGATARTAVFRGRFVRESRACVDGPCVRRSDLFVAVKRASPKRKGAWRRDCLFVLR